MVWYSPRGIKGLDGSLGLETPIALTAKIRTSYGTPSIIFLGSKVVSLQRSKLSRIHLELCFFFLSIKYPGGKNGTAINAMLVVKLFFSADLF